MSGHRHGRHGCDGDHNHDETPEMGLQYSLYSKIDLGNLECLNEKCEGSGKDVFKAWEDRFDFEKYVESDADEELLFNIPFTGNVKLKGVVVIGGEMDSHPSKMKLCMESGREITIKGSDINTMDAYAVYGKHMLSWPKLKEMQEVCNLIILSRYKNRPHMTFDDVGAPGDQEFDLHPDNTGTLEYSTKVVKFSSVHHLTLYFPTNFGSETTKVYYIGLRGEFYEAHRHGVTICTYEARPNISDHKTNAFDSVSHEVQ